MGRAAALLAGVVLLAGLAVYGTSWAARETDSQDVCVTGTPAGADWLRRDDSPVPWRWACVYGRPSGEVVRVEHTAFLP